MYENIAKCQVSNFILIKLKSTEIFVKTNLMNFHKYVHENRFTNVL